MFIRNVVELHSYLNQNPSTILNVDDIVDVINESIKQLSTEENSVEIDSLDLNKAVLSFRIEELELEPKLKYLNDQGQVVVYPSIEAIAPDQIEQIDTLFQQSTSHLVSAHFGHFLWINGKKHNSYLNRAISGYFEFIQSLLKQNKSDHDDRLRNRRYHQVGRLIRQLLFLSIKSKSIEPVRDLVLNIIEDSDHGFILYPLILLMLETKRVFSESDYEVLPSKCLRYTKEIESPFDRIQFLQLAARVDHRLNRRSQNWNNLIGEQYEILATERKDLAAVTFANKASRYYEEGGDGIAADRMARVYKEKAENRELGHFQSEVNVTEYVESCDGIIDQIVTWDLIDIIVFLSQSPQVIPDHSFLNDMATSLPNNHTFRYFISNQIYDINGHVAQHFTTEQEVTYMLILENYNQVIRLRFEVLVNRLILRLFNREDWTAGDILRILETETWYGQELVKPLHSSQSVRLKILDLLSPGIRHYFSELSKYHEDNEYMPDFTLSIDSLSLKIERILREICLFIDERTFYIRRDSLDREVTKEKDINMLLREPKLIRLLGKDFTLFLKALLVERVGNNLRNKVAHGFLYPGEYKNFLLINKLLIAILRLSIWKISTTPLEEE